MRFGVIWKWFVVVWCVLWWLGVFPRSGKISATVYEIFNKKEKPEVPKCQMSNVSSEHP